jgi:hypothetical protein
MSGEYVPEKADFYHLGMCFANVFKLKIVRFSLGKHFVNTKVADRIPKGSERCLFTLISCLIYGSAQSDKSPCCKTFST